ncbi:selenoprotein N-like isoform X2 [Babylonia areolata]|uniref:selenoprotein N-like isoform X2 n=1 Tax=Babylonia areolata TaxID=304850 RepID=UPI003FCFD854
MATKQTTDSEHGDNKNRMETENRDTTDGAGQNKQLVNQREGRQGYFVIKIPYWLCGCGTLMSIIVGALAVLVVVVTWPAKPDIGQWMDEVQDRAGKGGVNLFKSYDRNFDGYLSIYEFEPLIPHLKNLSENVEEVMPMETFLEYSPKDGEELLVVYANFTPLQLETMTKEDILTASVNGKDTLYGLRNWANPIRKYTAFGVTEFQSLLPENMEDIPLGKPYHVLPYSKSANNQVTGGIHTSSRYYPQVPKGKEGVLYRLLGMMHHHPFLDMRFPPRGTVACVQAFNDRYVHVVFRMHAEFQLNEPPLHPFWFTPAQFVGDLVMTRDGSHVQYFHMRVPNERRLNVDMEWMTGMDEGEEGMEVDIGYMPLMEWTVKEPSYVPVSLEETQSAEPKSPVVQTPDQIEWSSEVSREDVLRLVEIEFYPFKTVSYHNLTRAVQLSREENKPLHAIFLWGALDDQSC